MQDADCAPSSEGMVVCEFGTNPMGGEIRQCQVQIPGKAGDTPCVGTIDGNFTDFTGSYLPPKGYLCDVASGIYCDTTSMSCTALAMTGQSCTGSTRCVVGDYCDFTMSKCAATKPAGSPCQSFEECTSTTYCDPGSKTCTAKLADGSACTTSEACVGGSCVNSKCGGTSNDIGLALLCGGTKG
jgi:hypothetical protein